MSARLVRITLAAAAAASVATHAAAQLRVPPVQLFAGVGRLSGNSLGLVGEHGDRVYARHHSATAFQLGVETASPVRGVGLRLGYQRSYPLLALDDVRAVDYTQWTSTEVDRTRVHTLTLDADVHLPHVLDAAPYLLLGAGVKRYAFDQAYYQRTGQPALPRDQTQAGVHLGGGVDWSVGRYDLFVEGSYFLSRFRNDPGAATEPAFVQDRSFTVGLRIPLHR
ncbi:MAG TPA: hypothetical protein VF092_18280 [Longimicrobium sp.]